MVMRMYWFGVVFFMLVFTTHGLEDAYFSKSPKDMDVDSGKSVTLPCEVTPETGISYYWELNGSKIDNTTRRFQKGSNLHITRVDREKDGGQFTCIAQDQNGLSITSSAASLNIRWIEDVSVQLQYPETVSLIKPGIEVVLRCHVDGSGDIHYEWYRNAERLTKSSKIDIKKKKLHIKSVDASVNGVYRCAASNEAGVKKSEKNFALAVPGEHTALIQIVPADQIVKKGGNAYFDCVYEHADVTEWYFKDFGPMENTDRISIHSNGSLHIQNVQETDVGLYSCIGIRGESTEVPQSYAAELRLAYLRNLTFEPPLNNKEQKKIAPEGSFFQLTCLEPQSLPPAKKWWLSPAGHTVSDSGEVRVDDDGRLIIEKVRMENAGNYTCVAENVAGKKEIGFELIVTSKPVILVDPESVAVEENEEAVLVCLFEAKSEEHTTVVWKKDGKIIKHGEGNHQRIQIFKNGTLLIQSVEINDRGEYVCEISTIGFKPIISKPATISVIETLKFSPPPVSKKLELGSETKLHCKAQGTPPPIVHWEKESGGGGGGGGTEVDNWPEHIIDMNGTLHFKGVKVEDKGRYVCTASNSQGVINITVTIDVVVSPKFSVLPKNPTIVSEGSSVTLDCVVEGDPKPTIQWDRNLKMNDFDKSRFKVLENGTLYISEVRHEDANNYGCTAGSSAGLNRKEIQLIVQGVDDFEGSTVTKAVLITMSVAGAYIVLVIGLMVWCRYRRRSRKLPVTDTAKTENGDIIEHTELKDGVNGHGPSSSAKPDTNGIEIAAQKSDGAETTHSQGSTHSKKSNYDKLALSRGHLKELKLIGRGEFGDVLVGKLLKSVIVSSEKRNSTNSTEDAEVFAMVKALMQTKDENTLAEFKREIDIFAKLSHENVTKLFGLCREQEPHYMILEYTDWGDLKQFLQTTQKGTIPALTPVQSISIIHQIAKGMDHFSSNRYVHKDLAARNCLVTSTLTAKVGLPRLSRDPYSQEYCKHVNQIIPLRWMPHEVVYEDEFSTKSDVYAFGVVVWEVFSKGDLPFPKLNDNSILNKLKEKSLEWKAHKDTPATLEKLQELCWDVNPQNRPTFSHLAKEIEEILRSM